MTGDGLFDQVTSAERIGREMVELIDLGVLLPGDKLPAAEELAAASNVSRPVALQALGLLKRQGRVELSKGRRASVVVPAPDQAEVRRAVLIQDAPRIRQMMALREMLEVGLVRQLVATGLTDALRSEGDEILAASRSAESRDQWRRLDNRFHSLLSAGAGMPLLERLSRHVRASVAATFEFVTWSPTQVEDANGEHEALWAAIVASDLDAAERTIRAHVDATNVRIAALLAGR